MGEVKWFVAYVRSCQERTVAQCLNAQGIETYVPVQKVERKWSDRTKIIDRLLIPRTVFVHCDEATRIRTFKMAYGICSYLVDRSSGGYRVQVVPDRQMRVFMHVVGVMNGDGDLMMVDYDIEKGDMVRVISGPLKGFVCECVEVQSRKRIIIRLGMLGALLATVSASDVIKE